MQNDLISRSALIKGFEAAGLGDHSLIESVLAAGVYAGIENGIKHLRISGKATNGLCMNFLKLLT